LIAKTARPVSLVSSPVHPESPVKIVPPVNTLMSRDSASASLAAEDTKLSMTPDPVNLALLEPSPLTTDLASLAPLEHTLTSLLPLNVSSVLAVTVHLPTAATAQSVVLVSSQTSESNAKLALPDKSLSLILLALALPARQEPHPLTFSENQNALLANPVTILLMVSLAFLALLEHTPTVPEQVHAPLVSAVLRATFHAPSALSAAPETSLMLESPVSLAPTSEDSAASAVPVNVQIALPEMSPLPQTLLAFLANLESTTMVLSPSASHVPTEPSLSLMVLRAALLVFVALNPAQLPTFASLALQESSLLQEDFVRAAPPEHTPLPLRAAAANSALLDLLL